MTKSVREINKLREKLVHSHEVQSDILKDLEALSKNKVDMGDFNGF